jgi:hypothetical protein
MTSENGVVPQSRLGSARRPDVLLLVAVGPAYWREQADAICGPGCAPLDSLPSHFRYRRPAGGPESSRNRHVSAAKPCVFNSPFHFPRGCRSADASLFPAFDWSSPHRGSRPSRRAGCRPSCPRFCPKSAPACCLISRSSPLLILPLFSLRPPCVPWRKGCV